MLRQLCKEGGRRYSGTLLSVVFEGDARISAIAALLVGVDYWDCLDVRNVATKVALCSWEEGDSRQLSQLRESHWRRMRSMLTLREGNCPAVGKFCRCGN